MTRKNLFGTLLTAAAFMALTAIPLAAAETPQAFTTPDNVLSIQAPNDQWKTVDGSSYWFEMTDGDCTIAISHLSNGEALPAQAVAADSKEAVLQSLISTKNEVFVVNASSSKKEHLQDLIETVGSIKILVYDTKTAVTAAAPKSETTATAAKEITVYAANGSQAVITLGEDGQWRDKEGVIFYNTIDNMYYEELNQLFWNSDPNYWKEREAEGITTWITVYASDGSVDEIGLGIDNVWRNHNNQEFTVDSTDTYVGPDGAVWAMDPSYWGNGESASEDAEAAPEGEDVPQDDLGEDDYAGDEESYEEEGAQDWDEEDAESFEDVEE